MSILKIDSCKTSKSGKSLNIQSAGAWYLAKLDSGLDKLVGKTIDCETETSNYNGQDLTWINKYKVYVGTPAGSPITSVAQQSNGDIMKFMPFVSNTVAHALQAGLIKESGQVSGWAKAALEAAYALESIDGFRGEL